VFIATLLIGLWFSGFTQKTEKPHFTELDVERLNIVQADGKYCFVLTNGNRAPGAIIGGKEITRSNSNNAPSIIFYNEEGDESGALMTAGRMKDDGTYYGSSRLVFDRFRRDETLALQYYEDELGGYSGLLLQDTPEIFASDWIEGDSAIRAMPEGTAKSEALKKFRASAGYGARRMYVGKDRNKSVGVDLADGRGHTRLRMLVDSTGAPRLEFLDEKGEVSYRLPEASHH
jgi:hypothetical protein